MTDRHSVGCCFSLVRCDLWDRNNDNNAYDTCSFLHKCCLKSTKNTKAEWNDEIINMCARLPPRGPHTAPPNKSSSPAEESHLPKRSKSHNTERCVCHHALHTAPVSLLPDWTVSSKQDMVVCHKNIDKMFTNLFSRFVSTACSNNENHPITSV